jgi:hypothetical protein
MGMNDLGFTLGEMLEKYDDLVHFYGVIMEWVNKLHPHFLVV